MIATTITIKDPIRRNRPTRVIQIDGLIYEPLTRYFRRRNLSLASEIGYARAVSQLMNWSHAAKPGIAINALNAADTFNSFLHDLLNGTREDETLHAALGWHPSAAATVKRASQRIAEFSDWLADTEPHVPINPTDRLASAAERVVTMQSFSHRKSSSILSHLYKDNETGPSRVAQVAPPGRSDLNFQTAPAFPENLIEELLWKGFENEQFKDDPRPWIRWNLRDILITLICLYGGARHSEPLHLWVDDVYADATDPFSCKVLIHSPEEGRFDYFDHATGKQTHCSRVEFLAARGKQPLTMATGRRRAGWKGGLLTDPKRKAFEIFWITPHARLLFRKLWDMYIQHVRTPIKNTPWAFLTKDGSPMGTAAYADSFRDAVIKIGINPCKQSGGTPHALRHRYGQWLNDLQISAKAGQVCMHHSSIQSQETYRRLSLDKIAQEMASKALDAPKLASYQDWRSHD